MLTLYHGPTSVCAQKVRIGLAEIGLDYDSRLLNLMAGDQFASDYLKLNPNGVVPTLVDDGLVIIESNVILEHLDETYNGGRLMPGDQERRVKARLWLLRSLAVHNAINSLSYATVLRIKQMAGKTPQELEAMVANIPNPVLRSKRWSLLQDGVGSEHVGAALSDLNGVLADMEQDLARHPWLSGADYGIADAALLPFFDRLDRLAMSGLWGGTSSGVGAWLERSRQRDSYRVAISSFIGEAASDPMRETAGTAWPAIDRLWQPMAASRA